MTISLSLKKFTAAAAVAAPLALVACGSNGEEADQEGADTSTITSEATTEPDDEADDAEDAENEGDDAEGEDGAEGAEGEDGDDEGSATAAAGSDREGNSGAAGGSGGAGGEGDGAVGAAGAGGGNGVYNPLESGDISVAPQAPVEGEAANDQDASEIRGLVENTYNHDSLHAFIRYIPDNTCQRVIDANGGEQAFNLNGVPNMQMADMPGWNEMHISDISDINVDGGEASASVTVQTAEGPDTQTQRFLHEGGQWKFCDSQ